MLIGLALVTCRKFKYGSRWQTIDMYLYKNVS